MAIIPILLVGVSFFTLTALFGGKPASAEPAPKTPEQELADAIAKYVSARNQDSSDEQD